MVGRDVDIEASVDVDISELLAASSAVDALIKDLDRFDDEIEINVNVDALRALKDLELIEEHIDRIDGRNVDVSVDIDDILTAQYDIGALEMQVSDLDGEKINVKVDVDTATAHAQLIALRGAMASMKATTPVNPITSGVGNNGPPIFSSLLGTGINTLFKIGTISTIVMLLPLLASGLQLLVGIIGALGVALGVIGGMLTAFASSLVVAVAGIGGFAALAIPTIMKLYDENAELTRSEKELKKEIDSLIGSWGKLQRSLEKPIFESITSGVNALKTGLKVVEPVMAGAVGATDKLFESLDRSLQGERMTTFFDYLERSVEPVTINIGNGLGYMVQGLTNLMVALEPLTNWTAQGFENMMQDFADWGARMQESESLERVYRIYEGELR